jgi:hypothetical protein
MKKASVILLFVVFILIFVFTGCAGVSEETISIADVIAENLLISINNQDYESYKRDMDEKMLEAVPEEEFIKLASYFGATIGEYIADSKEVSRSGIQSDASIIIYEADYTGEDGKVTVTIVLSQTGDRDYRISGSWFDSPNIRENPYQ